MRTDSEREDSGSVSVFAKSGRSLIFSSLRFVRFRHACIKDLSPYTVSHIVWKLGNMQSPQWMPQNIVGIGELRVPPGYR